MNILIKIIVRIVIVKAVLVTGLYLYKKSSESNNKDLYEGEKENYNFKNRSKEFYEAKKMYCYDGNKSEDLD